MKKRKLKGFVLPTLYLLITISIFTGVILLGHDLSLTSKDYNYGTDILDDNVESVIVEDTVASSDIASPVEEGEGEVSVHYYSKDADEATQQKSLIFYENTYLPNTGILYSADSEFEVKAVADGKVSEILDDEFFGKCIVLEHNPSIRTYYYGLDNIEVAVGDEVASETILGTSKVNEIMNTKKTFLFEVYRDNKLMNPEEFIGTKITDYIEN